MGFCPTDRFRVCTDEEEAETTAYSPDDIDLPVEKRTRTDVKYFNFIILFLTFLVISVSVAYVRGDFRRVAYGYDDYGNLCGLKNAPIKGVNDSGIDYRNARYLKVTQSCSNGICTMHRACVEKCTEGIEYTVIPRCKSAVSQYGKEKFRRTSTFLERVGSDLSLCWREILVLLFICNCFSILPIITLRYCAWSVILSVLFVVTVASIAGSIYAWIMWGLIKQALNTYEGPDREDLEASAKNWLLAAIFVSLFTILYVLIVVSLRKRMKLVSTLFEEAGRSISSMPVLLLLPVLVYLFVAVLCFFLILGLIGVYTSAKPSIDSQGKVSFPANCFFKFMRWMLVFGFLWLCQFALAVQNIVVAGSVATWYFTRMKINLNKAVSSNFIMVVNYHLGSAAFASLIMAAVKAIRVICRILEKTKKNENKALFVVWKIIECCLLCFESFLKILNKNAYVMVALYGEPFCFSARRAFECITSNANRVAVVDGVGSFILTIMELNVAVGMTFIGVAILKSVEGLDNVWIPAVLIFIFSYMICHCFTSIYEMAIETLIVCFCEDLQINDGLSRPYFMNRTLMEFLQNSRRNSTEMGARRSAIEE